MFDRIVMQIKRELWENKATIIKVPFTGLIIFSCLFLLAGLYLSFSNQIHFHANGQMFISDTESKIEVLFDGNSNNQRDNSVIDYQFIMPQEPLTEQYPELARDIDKYKAIDEAIQPYESIHPIKQSSESILYRYSGAFDILLLILIIFPLMSSLVSDRKDKSVLFWRSLPVTETQNVLTKFFTVLVIMPIIYYVVLFLTLSILLLIVAAIEFSTLGHLLLSTVFGDLLIEIMQMGHGFVFALIWFLPMYCLLAMFTSFPSKFSSPLMMFLGALMFVVGDTTHFIKAYWQAGFETARALKWQYVWDTITVHIKYDWLIYGMLLSSIFIATTILLRRWRID